MSVYGGLDGNYSWARGYGLCSRDLIWADKLLELLLYLHNDRRVTPKGRFHSP